ncbi:MAG: hypothetical protein ACJAVA_000213 [Flavobacteriaceae bacterium]|jgi:hypothetical protein
MLGRIFNRWTKWKVYEEDKIMIEITTNHFTWNQNEVEIFCDIYKRENTYTGEVQYKTVKKY